uniref:Uncharacterized protein n=1 Tax=Cacopsylla melanoneura TaxID=428564 RepID=A0A8D8TBK5_9HEMI
MVSTRPVSSDTWHNKLTHSWPLIWPLLVHNTHSVWNSKTCNVFSASFSPVLSPVFFLNDDFGFQWNKMGLPGCKMHRGNLVEKVNNLEIIMKSYRQTDCTLFSRLMVSLISYVYTCLFSI